LRSKDLLIDRFLQIKLDGKEIDGLTTRLANVRRLRFIEERYFEIYLSKEDERRSLRPVIKGIYFSGRGKWVKPWMEIAYNPKLEFTRRFRGESQVNISDTGSEISLFKLLSDMIPPGGRLMVEYGIKDHPETTRALEAGAPPVLTKLGQLLWRNDFTSFKDWYFAEGWKEGNTKLQGEKPLDEEAKRRQIKKLITEIEEFLAHNKKAQELVAGANRIYSELLHEEKSA